MLNQMQPVLRNQHISYQDRIAMWRNVITMKKILFSEFWFITLGQVFIEFVLILAILFAYIIKKIDLDVTLFAILLVLIMYALYFTLEYNFLSPSLKYSYRKIRPITLQNGSFATIYTLNSIYYRQIKKVSAESRKDTLLGYKYLNLYIETDVGTHELDDKMENWSTFTSELQNHLDIPFNIQDALAQLLKDHPFFSSHGKKRTIFPTKGQHKG